MRRPIGKPKNRVTVYLEADLHMELKFKAARTGHKVSDLINDVLAKSLIPGETLSAQARYEEKWQAALKALRETGKPNR